MFVLFASSLDRGEVMTFRANNAQALGLTPQPRRFDLATNRGAFSVRIDVYERPTGADVCSDVRMPMPAWAAWQAVSGVVDVELGIDPNARHSQRATVRILAAEFEGPGGKRIRLTRPIILSAIVGSVAG